MSFDFYESEKVLQTAFGTAGSPVRYGRPVRERLVPLEALCGTKSLSESVWYRWKPCAVRKACQRVFGTAGGPERYEKLRSTDVHNEKCRKSDARA